MLVNWNNLGENFGRTGAIGQARAPSAVGGGPLIKGMPISPQSRQGAFGKNPYQAADQRYEDSTYTYPLKLLDKPQSLLNQNFDARRQAAMGTVGGGVQSGTKGAMTSLASSGGLSYADRQALSDQGNRQRVNLGQGALGSLDQQASQNMYDTQKFNIGQDQQTADLNMQLQNQHARDLAVEAQTKATNIYQQRMQEAMLERQLQAAREIAQRQGA
jgi:hypothetical protein